MKIAEAIRREIDKINREYNFDFSGSQHHTDALGWDDMSEISGTHIQDLKEQEASVMDKHAWLSELLEGTEY